MTNSSTIRGVAYYRMSTSGQDTSIPDQRDWVRRICPKEGVEIVREFEDPGIPGSEIEGRPDLQAMMTYCESQAARGAPIEAIVCWDADRFSRADSIRTAVCIARLMDAGVSRMLTAEGWIDWTDDIDRVLLNLRQDLSRSAYSKSLSKNVTRSALTRALAGCWPSSRPPFGFKAVPTNAAWHAWVASGRASLQPPKLARLQPDPERSEWVRWIFHEYSTTAASLGDLARRLRELGAPAPLARKKKNADGTDRQWGGEWTRYGVLTVLRNRAYLGELRWNTDRRGKYSRVSGADVAPVRSAGKKAKTKHNDAADVIVVPHAHTALVDADTFDACARKLAQTRWKRTTPTAGGGEWVLSGILHCGDCGERMVGHTDRHRRGEYTYTYRRYVCHANVRRGSGSCRRNQASQETILKEVAKLIRESFTDPKRIARLRAEVERLAGKEKKTIVAERERQDRRVKELSAKIAQGNSNLALLPPDLIPGVVAQVRAWQTEREQACRELARLNDAAESGQQFAARVKDALDKLQQLEELIVTAPAEVVRDTLAGLVRKITLHFGHGEELANGRRRTSLDSLEIELQPEAVHLLGTGGSTAQVTLTLRRSVRKKNNKMAK